MPFGSAAVGAFVAVVLQPRVVDRDMLSTAHFQAGGIASDVNRITATALGFAADRAVAWLVRVGMGAGQAERNRAAVAGAFEMHGDLGWGEGWGFSLEDLVKMAFTGPQRSGDYGSKYVLFPKQRFNLHPGRNSLGTAPSGWSHHQLP